MQCLAAEVCANLLLQAAVVFTAHVDCAAQLAHYASLHTEDTENCISFLECLYFAFSNRTSLVLFVGFKSVRVAVSVVRMEILHIITKPYFYYTVLYLYLSLYCYHYKYFSSRSLCENIKMEITPIPEC